MHINIIAVNHIHGGQIKKGLGPLALLHIKDLTAPVQLDWDLEHLTRQTETEGRFDRPARPDRNDSEAGPAPDAQAETALETA